MSFGKAGLQRLPGSNQKSQQEGQNPETIGQKTLPQNRGGKRTESLTRTNSKPKLVTNLRESNTFSDTGNENVGINTAKQTPKANAARPPLRNPRVPHPPPSNFCEKPTKNLSTPRGNSSGPLGFGRRASRELQTRTPVRQRDDGLLVSNSAKKTIQKGPSSLRASDEIIPYPKPLPTNKRLGLATDSKQSTNGTLPGVTRPPKAPSTAGVNRRNPTPTGPQDRSRSRPAQADPLPRTNSNPRLNRPPQPSPATGIPPNPKPPAKARSNSTAGPKPPKPAITNPITGEPGDSSGKQGLFRDKPSDRIARPGNPFAKSSKHSTQLGVMYDSGQVPCHVDYVGTRLKLNWTGGAGAENVDFAGLLPALCEGVVETRHPLGFIAEQGVKDLLQLGFIRHTYYTRQQVIRWTIFDWLQTSNAQAKLRPILKQVILSLRGCFPPDKPDAYKRGLNVVKEIAACAQEDLVPHLDLLLSKMSLKINDKVLRPIIFETLGAIEEHCGEGVRQKLKAKVPAYA